MLPCIYEGEPSQDLETLQQSAVDMLLSRCGQKAIPLPQNGAAISQLPDHQGPLACGPVPIERQQPKGKGTFCLGRGSFKDNSAFQSKGNFAARFNNMGKTCDSGSGSERLCFCSDLQRYIQSHVLFPSLPRPLPGDFAPAPPSLYLLHLFSIPCAATCSAAFFVLLPSLQHYIQSCVLLLSLQYHLQSYVLLPFLQHRTQSYVLRPSPPGPVLSSFAVPPWKLFTRSASANSLVGRQRHCNIFLLILPAPDALSVIYPIPDTRYQTI